MGGTIHSIASTKFISQAQEKRREDFFPLVVVAVVMVIVVENQQWWDTFHHLRQAGGCRERGWDL